MQWESYFMVVHINFTEPEEISIGLIYDRIGLEIVDP
jgi:hypothetical protein